MTHERVIDLRNDEIGLRGFLAIHSTGPGPAHGGIRVVPYPDLAACRADALRLSEVMTWKCLVNDLPAGGGKIAIDASAIRDRTAVMQVVGDVVESLGGDFFTGTDVGTTAADLAVVRSRTRWVASGDLSREAAIGVVHAIRATCAFSGASLRGLRVAVQGLGAVGVRVAQASRSEGAVVLGADPDPAARRRALEAGVTLVRPEDFPGIACDLYAPCALGGVLSHESVSALRCRFVVGAANNQLADDSVADDLHRREILHVPDFLASSGAAIRGVLANVRGTPGTDAEIGQIHDRTLALLRESAAANRAPLRVALERLRERLSA